MIAMLADHKNKNPQQSQGFLLSLMFTKTLKTMTKLSNPTEIWKPIKNYEGLYEISNFGRIKGVTNTTIYLQISNKTKRPRKYVFKCQ